MQLKEIKLKTYNGSYRFVVNDTKHPAYCGNYSFILVDDSIDENWKTHMAKNKKIIPKGTCFKEFGVIQNLYGTYLNVVYEGCRYNINPIKVIFYKND